MNADLFIFLALLAAAAVGTGVLGLAIFVLGEPLTHTDE